MPGYLAFLFTVAVVVGALFAAGYLDNRNALAEQRAADETPERDA